MHVFVCITGLYATLVPNEWYIMRRQEEGWLDADRKLTTRRGMRLLRKWNDVSHAIDIGNSIKHHYRTVFSWYARGNFIRAKENTTDETIVDIIENILCRENDAHSLATMNENYL